MAKESTYFPTPCFVESLTTLSKEFDSLGLPTLDVDENINLVLVQLIDNTNLLIRLNRKRLTQITDLNLKIKSLQQDYTKFKKTIDKCKSEISSNEDANANLQLTLRTSGKQLKQSEEKNTELKREITFLKKRFSSTANDLQHKMNKCVVENENLNDKITKNIGKFTSRDDILAREINKYKMNEEIYKETIQQLQQNNESLLEEILNLKEEVLFAMHKSHDVS